jgi:DNA-binding NarL/FixJ family response regulator
MSITMNNQNAIDTDGGSEFSSINLLNEQQWSYLQVKYSMTKRELQIAKHVCRGLANEDIAQALNIRHGTVKTHIRNLYRKLWVHNKISMLLRFMKDASVCSSTESPMQMLMESQESQSQETQCQEAVS